MKPFLFAGLSALLATGVAAEPLSLGEMQSRTETIATRYLAVWSSDAWSSVEGVPYLYGPRVRFYGQDLTQADLMAVKRRAIRQWPVRSYSHRPGTMRVQCNLERQRCVASSVTDYQVSNPARGTAKRGSAVFDLGVSFSGPKPVVLFEGGSIGRRRV